MRYLIFGAISTLINIIIFWLCSKIINFNVAVSNTISWMIAVMFAYITNKKYVFMSKTINNKELFKEITSFFSARIFTLILETIFLWIVINELKFNEIFMKIISNIFVIFLNFIFSKIFIFKNKEVKIKNKLKTNKLE